MLTERLRVLDIEKDSENISRACEILKNGGLVGIPTETVYGLAASCFDKEAVANIFKAKGRPQDNPLIVHISDMEMLETVVSSVPKKALELAEKFWPGPLTIIMPRGEKIPKEVSAGLDTVAVRMPSHKVARELISRSRLPLAAPSANLSGSPSPVTAEHVLNDLDGRIDAVIMSDKSEVGVESTVVSLCCEPPSLLRPGGVTFVQLKEILPDLVVDKAVLAEPEKGVAVASPGMKYKHYAPKAKVVLVDADLENFRKFVNNNADDGVFALRFEGEEGFNVPTVLFGRRDDASTQAALLFDVLRTLDEKQCKLCFARVPETDGVGLAVYNRLIRAAAFKVIKLPKIIGLTGPTGSGKTEFSKIAKAYGYSSIDCDKSARVVTERASETLKELADCFGADVILPDGSLDRKLLAKRAFKDEESIDKLNKIMLPAIVKVVKKQIYDLMEAGVDKILLDAPTLIESGLDSECDKVVAILAPKEHRRARIIERDGLTEEQADTRLNAGKSDEFYKSLASHIIVNSGDIDTFRAEINSVFDSLED